MIVANIKDIIGLIVLALCVLVVIGWWVSVLIRVEAEKPKRERKGKKNDKN